MRKRSPTDVDDVPQTHGEDPDATAVSDTTAVDYLYRLYIPDATAVLDADAVNYLYRLYIPDATAVLDTDAVNFDC